MSKDNNTSLLNIESDNDYSLQMEKKNALNRLKKIMYLVNAMTILIFIIVLAVVISIITNRYVFFIIFPPYYYYIGFIVVVLITCLSLIKLEIMLKKRILSAKKIPQKIQLKTKILCLLSFFLAIALIIMICFKLIQFEEKRILDELSLENKSEIIPSN